MAFAQRQNQRQRTGPEPRRQIAGKIVEYRQTFRCRQIDHMHDQRVEHGPPLGRKDTRDRLPVGGVGTQSIDRLGRKGQKPPVPQDLCRQRHLIRCQATLLLSVTLCFG